MSVTISTLNVNARCRLAEKFALNVRCATMTQCFIFLNSIIIMGRRKKYNRSCCDNASGIASHLAEEFIQVLKQESIDYDDDDDDSMYSDQYDWAPRRHRSYGRGRRSHRERRSRSQSLPPRSAYPYASRRYGMMSSSARPSTATRTGHTRFMTDNHSSNRRSSRNSRNSRVKSSNGHAQVCLASQHRGRKMNTFGLRRSR